MVSAESERRRIMPSRENEKRRFPRVLSNRRVDSALSDATENNRYAELGIMGISKVFTSGAAALVVTKKKEVREK